MSQNMEAESRILSVCLRKPPHSYIWVKPNVVYAFLLHWVDVKRDQSLEKWNSN